MNFVREYPLRNRTPIFGLFFLILSVAVPVPAHAAWQVFYTGEAQKMFGAHGRGNFATRSQCEAYIRSSAFVERNTSYCSGFDVPAAKVPPREVPSRRARLRQAARRSRRSSSRRSRPRIRPGSSNSTGRRISFWAR